MTHFLDRGTGTGVLFNPSVGSPKKSRSSMHSSWGGKRESALPHLLKLTFKYHLSFPGNLKFSFIKIFFIIKSIIDVPSLPLPPIFPLYPVPTLLQAFTLDVFLNVSSLIIVLILSSPSLLFPSFFQQIFLKCGLCTRKCCKWKYMVCVFKESQLQCNLIVCDLCSTWEWKLSCQQIFSNFIYIQRRGHGTGSQMFLKKNEQIY